jgi:nucleotide-binding universal stress UspA family protein
MSGGRESKHLPAVVVGVDGSAGSREALQWAIAEARMREGSTASHVTPGRMPSRSYPL